MTSESKLAWLVVGALVAVAGALLLVDFAKEELAPQPRAAGVAIEVAGTGVAVAGPVEIEAGAEFTLRAFLEAEDRRGRPVYYTEATRLVVDGREVAAAELSTPERFAGARILWFTVEGSPPFLEVENEGGLAGFRFREVLRPDWPRSWSTPGSIEPSAARSEVIGPGEARASFGTQRYQVRIELFGPESEITPRARFKSPGAEDLPDGADRFATAVVRLPAPLDVPSRMFGLSQIEPAGGAPPALKTKLADWTVRGIAFTRLGALKLLLDRAEVGLDELSWRRLPLDGSEPWGAPGDLLRAGGRLVYLYRDGGTAGRLDKEDLCLDFEKGARVRHLGRVFTGEGLVERGTLGAAVAP